VFFFEKKNQKTFVCWSLVTAAGFVLTGVGLAAGAKPRVIVVQVEPDGRYNWGGLPVLGYPALAARFAIAAHDVPKPGLDVEPTKGVTYRELSRVFQLAQRYYFYVGVVGGY
jgi:hypothetical protein